MKPKAFLKAFLIHTCIYTTALFTAAMLFVLLGGITSFAAATYLLILAFCACLALAIVIFAYTNLSVWWRTILHAILTLGGFYLCIFTRYSGIGTAREALTLLAVLMTLLYGVCMGIFLSIRHAKMRKQEEKRYQRVFAANSEQKRR